MYRFAVEQLSVPCPEIFRWCLDFPADRSEVSLSDLERDGVVFQGWVLPGHGGSPKIEPFVRARGKSRYFDLNMPRPDVVEKVLAEKPENHPRLHCGFRFRMPLEGGIVIFGFRVGGLDFELARLRVEGESKVLEGLDGWLFLDNDTNRSVDQFRGKWLLDRNDRRRWLAYLDGFAGAAEEAKADHAVLIAPAKEMVLDHYYPFPKGRVTPVEQVLELAAPRHRLVYPAASLRGSAEPSFRMMDTHWTPYGAMLAVLDVAAALGIDRGQAEAVFAQDTYKERVVGGDLGNKFYPPRTSAEKFLVSFNYHRYLVYDNHLPNFGRVMVLANPEALRPCKCLIFGSSSIYSALDYCSRLFSELIIVHSAGNIDVDLLKREAPRYVIAQTNGRFVVRAPVVGHDLKAEIAQKLASLAAAERAGVLEKAGGWLAKTDTGQIRYYHDMLDMPPDAGRGMPL